MTRWLRRNTTECEREAQRWLKELQHCDYSVACMERLLEEITAPLVPSGYPWPGSTLRDLIATGGQAAGVARYMLIVSKFPIARFDILIRQEPNDALLTLHEELVRSADAQKESLRMLYLVAEPKVSDELRRRSLRPHGVRRMKRPTCPTCVASSAYCAELDRYYCKRCDTWLEAPCDCLDNCTFLDAQRLRGDAKPSEVMADAGAGADG